jgi:hypothetical protein
MVRLASHFRVFLRRDRVNRWWLYPDALAMLMRSRRRSISPVSVLQPLDVERALLIAPSSPW